MYIFDIQSYICKAPLLNRFIQKIEKSVSFPCPLKYTSIHLSIIFRVYRGLFACYPFCEGSNGTWPWYRGREVWAFYTNGLSTHSEHIEVFYLVIQRRRKLMQYFNNTLIWRGNTEFKESIRLKTSGLDKQLHTLFYILKIAFEFLIRV